MTLSTFLVSCLYKTYDTNKNTIVYISEKSAWTGQPMKVDNIAKRKWIFIRPNATYLSNAGNILPFFWYIDYLVLWYLNALIDVHQSWEFKEICCRRNSRKVGLNKVTKYANFFFYTNLLSSVKCLLCKFHISYSTLQCASNTCKSTIRLNTPITFASYILGSIIEILAGTRHARIDN